MAEQRYVVWVLVEDGFTPLIYGPYRNADRAHDVARRVLDDSDFDAQVVPLSRWSVAHWEEYRDTNA